MFFCFLCFSMVLARFFKEIIGFSLVFFGFSLVFFGFPLVFFSFSLDLLFFITRVHVFLWFYWFYRGYPRVSFGSRLVLQWVWPSCTAPDYGGSSLAHSGEGGWSSPEMSQILRSSKKLQNDSFLKLFVRVSGSGSACVSSPISSDARNEEDIIVSGLL